MDVYLQIRRDGRSQQYRLNNFTSEFVNDEINCSFQKSVLYHAAVTEHQILRINLTDIVERHRLQSAGCAAKSFASKANLTSFMRQAFQYSHQRTFCRSKWKIFYSQSTGSRCDTEDTLKSCAQLRSFSIISCTLESKKR